VIATQQSRWWLIGKLVFGVAFIAAGVLHFVRPDAYMKIMPPYLPWHRPLVFISGVAEVGLGALLLVPRFRAIAAWGLIALLLVLDSSFLNLDVSPFAMDRRLPSSGFHGATFQ
jgi:uncharacterized membrane protein